jgi:FtsP/CotA-like multicopper oxidase with cupredoxin domain
MLRLSRRRFLAATALAGLAGATAPLLLPIRPAAAAPTTTIKAGARVIEVRGRAATVLGLLQPDGSHGLVTEAGRQFRVNLENGLGAETLVHWHGLTPPWRQDGVPGLSQAPIPAAGNFAYDFPLTVAGTNWMHSHHGLQEQRLLAAPLIVRDPAEAGADLQEVVVLFHDFTFRDPDEILAGLRGGGHDMAKTGQKPGAMDHAAMGHGTQAPKPAEAMAAHLHDVEHDAFLANDRTLDDPAVFRVERGGHVRLRLINGAAATNFWLDLDRLDGRLIAVDGDPVAPILGRRFEFAIAQRLDIVIELPQREGAWPIFAVREGDRARTGFVLATSKGTVAKLPGEASAAAAPVGLELERRLRASQPLAERPVDRRHTLRFGEQPGYMWTLAGAADGRNGPLAVRQGERVEITFADRTSMAHPMHLHGHHFQVVAIDGQRFAGAMRDTVLVPAGGSVTIAFDAANPGRWALHCHNLYHMVAGMMTTVEYEG